MSDWRIAIDQSRPGSVVDALMRLMREEKEREFNHYGRCPQDDADASPLFFAHLAPHLYEKRDQKCSTCGWSRTIACQKTQEKADDQFQLESMG